MCLPAWASARTEAKRLADDRDAVAPRDISADTGQGPDAEPVRNREAVALEPQLA
jgi:hypothetical protein